MMHPMGPALSEDFPDWKVSRLHWYYDAVISVENEGQRKSFLEREGLGFVEPDFFEIFTYIIVSGSDADLLAKPNSIAISASTAKKLFGVEEKDFNDLIGENIQVEGKLHLELQAIFEDPPQNTDWKFNYLMSYEGARIYPYSNELKSWNTINGHTRIWIRLPNELGQKQAEQLLMTTSDKYLINRNGRGNELYFALESLGEIHLNPRYKFKKSLNKNSIQILILVGLLLLFAAGINFVNLSTAQSVQRAKEIAIKKVLGSHKNLIVRQFLIEVHLTVFFSCVIALIFAEVLLNQLDPITGYNLSLAFDFKLLLFTITLISIVSFSAGFYPAMILSRFSPIKSLRINIGVESSKGISLRKILVTVQLLIAQTLIFGTIVVTNQTFFLHNHPKGFESKNILTFPIPEREEAVVSRLRSELMSLNEVSVVSAYIASPSAAEQINIDGVKYPESNEIFSASRKNVDSYYYSLFGLELISGRFYEEASNGGYQETIVNETFAKELGFNPQEAIGKDYVTEFDRKGKIVGVIKDFHTRSLRYEKEPLFLITGTSQYFECGVKLKKGVIKEDAIARIEKIWQEIFPNKVFDGVWFADRLSEQYKGESKALRIMLIASILTICICCLGVYSLIAFITNQKRREIGIRKVFGASIKQIIYNINNSLVYPIMVSFIVSAVLSYYLMSNWLEQYAFRINIHWSTYLISLLLVLTIVLTTVLYRSARAALVNPVDSLRNE